MVRDAAAGTERRVFLSSVRAPRLGRRDEKAEPYAFEAKEFLRQRLIGELWSLTRHGGCEEARDIAECVCQ